MTQTPEIKTENSSSTTRSDDSVVQQRWTKRLLRFLQTPRKALATIYTFMNELSRDHTFWLHMMAVRSGAAMTVLTVASVCAYAMTLPFMLAAIVITGVAVVAGIATVGMIAGTQLVIGRMRAAYGAVKKGGTSQASPISAAPNRVFSGAVNKVAAWRVVKAIGKTHIWQVTERFIHDQKKWMLGGTALSGAALTTGMSAWVLAAQLAVLPVVAIGSALSFVALWAVAGVISGAAGLYFGTTSLVQWHQVSRAQKAAAALIANKEMAAPGHVGQAPLAVLSTRVDFLQSRARAGDDTAPGVADLDVTLSTPLQPHCATANKRDI